MTWDKNRPFGNAAISVGDNAIRENNEWLEDSLALNLEYPGDTDTRGRLKFQSLTKAAQDSLLSPAAGHIVHRTDLKGSGQVGLVKRSLYVGSPTNAWIVDRCAFGDASDRTTIQAVLTANDNGFMLVRSDLDQIDIWDGAAWVEFRQNELEQYQFLSTTASESPDTGRIGSGAWSTIRYDSNADNTPDADLSLTVNVPALGSYHVEVNAKVTFAGDSSGPLRHINLRLLEDGTEVASHEQSGNADDIFTAHLHYRDESPTASTSPVYTIEGRSSNNSHDVNPASLVTGGVVRCWIETKLLRSP